MHDTRLIKKPDLWETDVIPNPGIKAGFSHR